MQDLNFFDPYVEKRKFKFEKLYYICILIFIAVIFFIIFINQIKINNIFNEVDILKKQTENKRVKNKVKEIKTQKNILKKMESEFDKIEVLEKFFKEQDIINENLLKNITVTMPETIFLNSININSSSIHIEGTGVDKFSIAQFESNLKKVKTFRHVFISNISFEDDYYNFSLSITLKDGDEKGNAEKN